MWRPWRGVRAAAARADLAAAVGADVLMDAAAYAEHCEREEEEEDAGASLSWP